jgi:hypothetical protein
VVANVLAYMDKEEEELFYKESFRILKKSGFLVATHSNILFDIFTFNNLTVEFYKNSFEIDIQHLLNLGDLKNIETYGIRENPLIYAIKLNGYGFKEEEKRFFHHHPAPPRMADTKHARNTIYEELEKEALTQLLPNWKENFTASTFGVRAVKEL